MPLLRKPVSPPTCASMPAQRRRLSIASGNSARSRPIVRHQPQFRLDCSPAMRPFSHSVTETPFLARWSAALTPTMPPPTTTTSARAGGAFDCMNGETPARGPERKAALPKGARCRKSFGGRSSELPMMRDEGLAPKKGAPATRAPSPLAGEGGPKGRMRGRFRLVAAAVSLAPLSAPTPHPPRFARHLLPQGEKGFPSRPLISARFLCFACSAISDIIGVAPTLAGTRRRAETNSPGFEARSASAERIVGERFCRHCFDGRGTS